MFVSFLKGILMHAYLLFIGKSIENTASA